MLYLALLLHDVGKAEHHGRGKHPEASAALALRAAKRLRLDSAATQTLRIIVENHLVMASISQRRDLDDPAVVRQFARQVGTPETLNLLTLLTFADSQGTSDKLWNGFKDALLWDLHARAMPLLTGGTEFIRAGKAQRESLLQEVRELAPAEIGEEELQAQFAALPPRYFQIHTAAEILDDLALTHRFLHRQILEDGKAWSPLTAWQDEPNRGYNAGQSLHLGPRRPFQQNRRLLQRRRPEHSRRADFHPHRRRRARHVFCQRRPHRQSRHARAARKIRQSARPGFDRWGG